MAFNAADYREGVALADGDHRAAAGQAERLRTSVNRFADAGARLLVTPTDGACALASDGGDSVVAQSRETARLYRSVVNSRSTKGLCVVGAMGPSPQLLMLEEVTPDALSAAYAAQARALADGGADVIFCRSFVELEGLLVAVRAARSSTGLSVIGGMRFDAGMDGTETTLGVSAPQACSALEAAGVVMVALDAGERPDTASGVAALMRKASTLPIWAQVSAGTAQLEEGRVEYPETPAEFVERARSLVKAGANIIGGGPGVTADHVAAFSASLVKRIS